MTPKSTQNEPPGCSQGVPGPIRALRTFCVISGSVFGAILGSILGQKIDKNNYKNSIKNQDPKRNENVRLKGPKTLKNCGGIIEKSLKFSRPLNLDFCNTSAVKTRFSRFRGSQNPLKIHQKSMQNRCLNLDAKIMHKCLKFIPKWDPKSNQNRFQNRCKTYAENGRLFEPLSKPV